MTGSENAASAVSTHLRGVRRSSDGVTDRVVNQQARYEIDESTRACDSFQHRWLAAEMHEDVLLADDVTQTFSTAVRRSVATVGPHWLSGGECGGRHPPTDIAEYETEQESNSHRQCKGEDDREE